MEQIQNSAVYILLCAVAIQVSGLLVCLSFIFFKFHLISVVSCCPGAHWVLHAPSTLFSSILPTSHLVVLLAAVWTLHSGIPILNFSTRFSNFRTLCKTFICYHLLWCPFKFGTFKIQSAVVMWVKLYSLNESCTFLHFFQKHDLNCFSLPCGPVNDKAEAFAMFSQKCQVHDPTHFLLRSLPPQMSVFS